MSEKKIHFDSKSLIENYKKFDELILECETQSDEIFENLKEICQILKLKTEKILSFASIYDFSESKPGNGFWSFVHVSEAAVEHSIEVCRKFRERKCKCGMENFRAIEVSISLLDNLNRISEDLIKMHESSKNGNLFHQNIDIKASPSSLKISSFYDSPFGFYFEKPLQRILKFIFSGFCSHFDFYGPNKCQLLQCDFLPFINIFGYFRNAQLRAEKIEEILREGDVEFLKAFWDKIDSKSVQFWKILAPSVAVDLTFKIDPKPLKKFANIQIPLSHIGEKLIKCRLISTKLREGMARGFCRKIYEPSTSLIIHLHGGAFVANSSKSGVLYLRELASTLDVPILSIDYTLALEAPFPRAVEEVFYVYCWILSNHAHLGTTAEKIILLGDSAGSNLAAACIIKCIEMKVKIPKAFVSFCGAFSLEIAKCPSYFLTFMDPLLMHEIIMKIKKVYLKNDEGKNFYASPILTPDVILKNFPSTFLVTSINDPLLDGSVELAKKLKELGVKTELEIFGAINHGFMNFIHFSHDCKDAFQFTAEKILNLLKNES